MADILSRNAPADEPTAAPAEETAAPRMVVRRGALAAGAVLAAGSAFTFTLLHPTAPVADQQSLAGPYAGQGVLDGTAPATPAAAPVVISPAAASSGLDAGTGAPSSWTPVAFPGGSGGAGGTGGATGTAAAPAGPGRSAPAGSSRTPAATPAVPPAAPAGGTTSNPGSTGPAATGTSTPAGSSAGPTRGPVAGAVNGLGTTVTNTGTALGGAVDPVVAPAAATVGGLVGGLL